MPLTLPSTYLLQSTVSFVNTRKSTILHWQHSKESTRTKMEMTSFAPRALFVKPIKGVPGYPGSILVWPLTNRCWLPPVGLIIVTQHRESVLTFVTRLFSGLRAKQSQNKCIVAKALWTESHSEWTDMELQHFFFDSTEELSRQGYFQWIYSLRAAGTPEISVRPCLSFSSGNPQNDNSPKSR